MDRSRARPLVVVALLAPVTVACTTSPERLCDHFVALAEGESGQLPGGLRAEAVARCVADKSALRRSEPKKYACLADCLMDKRHLVDAAECEPTCGVPPKPRPADEPAPEGVPGLWVDPYADAAESSGAEPDADGGATACIDTH